MHSHAYAIDFMAVHLNKILFDEVKERSCEFLLKALKPILAKVLSPTKNDKQLITPYVYNIGPSGNHV